MPTPLMLSGLRAQVKPLRPDRATKQARSSLAQVLSEAGVVDAMVDDALLAVSEVAGNAAKHGKPPYEMRIFSVHGCPVWCDIFDGGDYLNLPEVFANLGQGISQGIDEISGRGLELVHWLTHGRCDFYPAYTYLEPRLGKAVAFALPTRCSSPVAAQRPNELIALPAEVPAAGVACGIA
ncbi:ATP-binding protein [Nonomuraea sp. NPDC049400]|uniref:ATP-binding protein n=1 Tax=Nonomuraea sp. NPDC049400 TaxID=3364352 RepID=UPI00378D90C7